MIFLILPLLFINSVFAETVGTIEEKKRLNLSAKNINFVNGEVGARYIKASGDVEILYPEYKLCSNELTMDEKNDIIIATGDVKLMETAENGALIRTSAIDGNKDISKAHISSFIFEKGNVYGTANEGDKTGEIIKIKQLKVSSCSNAKTGVADWSVKGKTAKYDKEKDEITLYNTIFYVKQVPVLWLPYFTISPSRTHGFLAPEAGVYNDQRYISLPYFISHKEKIHYAIIKPEFYQGLSDPENKSRVNNLYASYKYEKNNDEFFIHGKFASNAYNQNALSGLETDEKVDRYYLQTNGNFEYSNGNYGFNYAEVSDRFFRKKYDFTIENYLTRNVYLNFFSENKKHIFTTETVSFVPIAFEKTDSLAKIDTLSDYKFKTKVDKNVKFYNDVSLISVSRKEGINYKRVSDSAGLEVTTKTGKIETMINPELRVDFYSKNYKTISLTEENDTLARAIPSLFIENKLPIHFKLQNQNNFLFKFEPQLNFYWTRENMNNGKIANEDSSSTFLNSDTILKKQYISGYDAIDEGLSTIYGAAISGKHLKSGSSASIFLGQRAKVYVEKSLKDPEYSQYAGKANLSLFGVINMGSNVILSEDFDTEYASSNAGLTFKYMDINFQNTFIRSNLTSASENTSENRYGLTFKTSEKRASFTINLVQNNKFINEEKVVEKRIVSSEYIFNYTADCFDYAIGIKRDRYTLRDQENKYQIFGKFRLLLT